MTKRDAIKKAIIEAMSIRAGDIDLVVNIILTSQKEFDLTKFESALEASENDQTIRNLWVELYTPMLEQLKKEMLDAFWVWSCAQPTQRNHLWDAYTKKREAFLRESMGDKYQAIQMVEYFK